MKQIKRICKEWNKLKTDENRWKYLLYNKDKVVLVLDNDQTLAMYDHKVLAVCGVLEDEEDDIYDKYPLDDFDNDVGNSDGVYTMLQTVGIKAVGV